MTTEVVHPLCHPMATHRLITTGTTRAINVTTWSLRELTTKTANRFVRRTTVIRVLPDIVLPVTLVRQPTTRQETLLAWATTVVWMFAEETTWCRLARETCRYA